MATCSDCKPRHAHGLDCYFTMPSRGAPRSVLGCKQSESVDLCDHHARVEAEIEAVARLEAENAELRADRDRLLGAAKTFANSVVHFTFHSNFESSNALREWHWQINEDSLQKLREAIGER